MNQEQKRIKIAEACGYLNPRIEDGHCRASSFQTPEGKYFGTKGIPDYFNDRDAITEAVISAMDRIDKQVLYCKHIKVMQHADDAPPHTTLEFAAFNATAAQRAEAFGKTLSLW